MQRNLTKDMTAGNPLKLILRFSIPILIGNLLQQGYNLFDAAIVGQFLGADALAAVGATASIQVMVLGFCLGSCHGFSIPIARQFGAHEHEQLRKYLFNGLLLSACLATVMTLICTVSCRSVLQMLSTPSSILSDTYSYIIIIFCGIPFTVFYNYASCAIRAIGDSSTPFRILFLCTIMNILLDILLVPIVHMGCAGAALATVIAQMISAVLSMRSLLTKYPILKLTAKDMRRDRLMLRELSVLGFPMGLQSSITAIGSMVMQTSINIMGNIYVSGYTAYTRFKLFCICPIDALASATATFAGQNMGARNLPRIRKGLRDSLIISVSYSVCIGAIFLFFGRRFSMIFVSPENTEVLDIAAAMLKRLGLLLWMVGILNVTRMTVQGLGFSLRAIIAGFTEMVARTLMCVVAVPAFGFPAICLTDQAAWLSAVTYITITAVYCLRQLNRRFSGNTVSASTSKTNC